MNESIYQFLEDINKENGSNYKVSVLKNVTDIETISKLLKMTYDKVNYNFWVGKKSLAKLNYDTFEESKSSILDTLNDIEENICSRKVTGNAALEHLEKLFSNLSYTDSQIVIKVIERDLKIGIGKTQINKVFKNLIKKPTYMRCDVYSDKTAKNIKFPAFIQLKSDGTYREFRVEDGIVESQSRSGEQYEYPSLFEQMTVFPNGYYNGELTVLLDEKLLKTIESDLKKLDKKNNTSLYKEIKQRLSEEGPFILPRSLGNGLINSSDVPHENLRLDIWDFITFDDYKLASLKDKKNPPKIKYSERFGRIKHIKTTQIKATESYTVNNLAEALKITSSWMQSGFEGGVLKDMDGVFKDGTSKHQLKLKIKIQLEVRCTALKPGTVGTKREGKVGSLEFSNDEGTIVGSCSGFNDAELDAFSENPEMIVGKVFEVECNDITKARGKTAYALSHPVFIEIRNDKDETDTLEKALKLKNMAMALS